MQGWLQVGVGLLVAVLFQGCGPGAGLAKVSGKVTVAGQPMSNIEVTFVPESGGRPASGLTDANGNFSLSTVTSGDGAAPGKHKVSFTQPQQPPAPGDYSPPKPVSLPFNAKYASADTSGITAEVVAGKSNELPAWDLEK